MFKPALTAILAFTVILTQAQFGTYDPGLASTVSQKPLIVVLDNANSAYNAALKSAVEKHWTLGSYSFSTLGDIGASGYLPDNNYLLHTAYTDPKTFEMHHVSVVAGWKMKKSQKVSTKGNAAADIPAEQVVAGILFDPDNVNDGAGFMMDLYVKHLQDYIDHASKGKIADRTAAIRLYESRTRFVKDGKLMFSTAHLDKTFPADAEVKEVFSSEYEKGELSALENSVTAPSRDVYVSDVVITGDYKTKHCFKRVFNTGTGEIVYLHDEPALHGKKEGFMLDDMKSIARSR